MPALRTDEQMKKYLESRVLKEPGGCWLWQGPLDNVGRGKLEWRRAGVPTVWRAHRAAYIVFKGDLGNLHVCHTCDNPSCVNPDHLFLGTHLDNMADRDAKGRQPKGIEQGNAVLTEDQVREIRRLVAGGMSMTDTASHYGVNHATVWRVVNRKGWKHI